jgi:RND family efflux transporter MFP subunit
MRSRHSIAWGELARAAAALTVALLPASCSPADGETAGGQLESAGPVANARVINVEVMPIAYTEFAGFIRVTGEVEAMNDVTVAAEETGRLERFLVAKGRRVRRGQPIARLEADLLTAQVEEARAAAALAKEEYQRQRQLWVEDSIGTELAYVQKQYQGEIAAARLAQLETRLDHTVIRAPVSGVFDEKYVEEGEMAVTGAPVVRIVSTARVKVIAGVPERFVQSVQAGTYARVTFDIFPGREFGGRIGFVGTSVNESNRTFLIEIVLDNPGGIMKPAMVANVEVQRERLEQVVVVPQQVALRSDDGYKVFVAEERDGSFVAKARAVVLGSASGNDVVIAEGLMPGDLVITVGQQLVDDESWIRIVNEEGSSGPGGSR